MTVHDDHRKLALIFQDQRDFADPAPVERVALQVVIKLLVKHHPSADESRSSGYMCLHCWEPWPCDIVELVNEMIEEQR